MAMVSSNNFTTEMNMERKAHEPMACPICKGSMDVVWNSENRWRVSCMKNDFLDDDIPPPCTCPDFYGATKDAAIAAFMAANV